MRFYRVATWALVILGAVAAVAAGMAMARGGIGWDSPVDARALGEIRALPEGVDKDTAYGLVISTSEFYGILIAQLAELLHRVATGASTALDPFDLATYRWQGAVTITMAVAAAACLGYATGRVLRSSLAGAFAWALTMTTPLYFGMSHVDFKDMPVAAGLSLMSAGLMLSRTVTRTIWRWLVAISLVSVGSITALATRPGSWPLAVALAVGSMAAFVTVDLIRHRLPFSAPAIGAVAVAAPVTLLVLWSTNPFGRISVFGWLGDAFSVMRAYPWDGVTRVAGQDFPATDLPWWYIPAWLVAQLPLLTSLALAWSAVVVVASLMRKRWAPGPGTVVSMSPLLIQGLVLPVVITVSGAVLYDGLRHVLFMIPALSCLAALGIAALEHVSWPARLPRVLGAGAALLVVVSSAWATLRWIPYSYAFINPIAGWNHQERAWELDYWGVSAAEGVRRLQESGLPAVTVLPTITTSDLVGSIWPDDAKAQAPDGYGLYVFRRGDASVGACEPIFTIERDGQVLGEGARCTKWDR